MATRRVRQLTFPLRKNDRPWPVADCEPAFLPDGRIVFTSTRDVHISDCWYRAGGNIYCCDADGGNIRRLTCDQLMSNHPQVLDDGRIVFTRWEYNDRNALFAHPLISMNPDGTAQTVFYGNYSMFPAAIIHAHGIPGSPKSLAIVAGHHSIYKGKLGLIDRAQGLWAGKGIEFVNTKLNGELGREAADFVQPEPPDPFRPHLDFKIDVFGQVGPQYAHPFAFDEEHYLCSFCPEGYLPPFGPFHPPLGVYYMKPDGERELLAFDDWQGTGQAIPVMARRRPAVRASLVRPQDNWQLCGPPHNCHIRGIGAVVLEGADHPRATGDSGKTLGQRTYGTDAGKDGESQTGDWRKIGILLAMVESFSIQNVAMKDSHCWAISLERCAHGTLRDLDFASTQARLIDGARQTILNQDGIDLRMGCHDILIENITGFTGDHLIALTAIPKAGSVAGRTGSTMVSSCQDRGQGQDDIRHVIIRNVRGYCAGGHHIVRFLNTSGIQMYDVILDGLIDTSPQSVRGKAAVKIGDTAYGGGIAPLGDTRRLIINNIISRCQHTILIGGSLCDSIISNVVRYEVGGDTITVASGPEHVRDVTIANVRVVAGTGAK